MPTKRDVLSMLEAARGRPISGESIAKALNVSRNAVWKSINALREEGHTIESIKKLGYRLDAGSDILSAEGIVSHINAAGKVPSPPLSDIHVFPALTSTNLTAKELALHGAQHGTTVVSDTQSAGRGRYGRTFFSPPGAGLYMSIILKPDQLPLQNPTLVTSIAAALTLEAIESVSHLRASVKWVNDLYIHGKKVCGILTEAVLNVESGAMDFIVLGIGINVNTPKEVFPAELVPNVSSILLECGERVNRNALAAEVLSRVLSIKDAAPALALYKERLLYLGERVVVHAPTGTYEATALSVDDECHLIVKTDDGEKRALSSGEISIRPRV